MAPAALRRAMKIVRGGGSVPASSADSRASGRQAASFTAAASPRAAGPLSGGTIIPGRTAAQFEEHVSAQQSMGEWLVVISWELAIGQSAETAAHPGPDDRDRKRPSHISANSRHICLRIPSARSGGNEAHPDQRRTGAGKRSVTNAGENFGPKRECFCGASQGRRSARCAGLKNPSERSSHFIVKPLMWSSRKARPKRSELLRV